MLFSENKYKHKLESIRIAPEYIPYYPCNPMIIHKLIFLHY